jgi:type IV pilus assembly protein PilA
MTEPSNTTKFSKAAIAAIISAVVGIVAAYVAGTLEGNPDFKTVFKVGVWLLLLCIACSFVFGLIGLIGLKPKGRIFSITAIILSGLLFLSLPNVLRFTARSKQSEAKFNLLAIYAAYQSYHSQYHTYPTSPSILVGSTTYNCLNIAGWEPKGQLRYTYECEGSQAYYPGWDWVPSKSVSPCSPAIATHATKDSFTIAACGNLDNDATLDEWTIDDAKHLRNVLDDVRN